MSDSFNGRYTLDEAGNPMPCPDLIEWAIWFERSVAQWRIVRDDVDGHMISTIFLGLDYSFDWDGPTRDPLTYKPVLWETMAWDRIGSPILSRRYTSRELALAGHAETVAWVQRNLELQESQLAEMLTEISSSVVPDRAISHDNRESPEGQAEPSEVDAGRIWDIKSSQQQQNDRSDHDEQGKH